MASIEIFFYSKYYSVNPRDCALRYIRKITNSDRKLVLFRLATIDDYESIRRRPASNIVLTAINERRCYLMMF